MNKFYIFIILFFSCLSYNYNDGAYYRPRYRLSSLSTPFERTLFGRKPFGRTPFGRKPFGRTPFDRPPFRNRFKMRLYRENYYRDAYNPVAASLRQKKLPEVRTEIPKHPNYSLSVFGFVKNGQFNATKVTDTNKWIARVVPTNILPAPTICTAACVKDRIFITAAICIYSVKVVYTRVVYQDKELPPIAFVVPSKETKEMFDDIGIIVVDSHTFKGTWHTIDISPKWMELGRPDDQFIWHARPEAWHRARAIGYVSLTLTEDFENVTQDEPSATLYQLEVKVSNFLCNYLYNTKTPNNAYFVPCYGPCNLVEFYSELPKCKKYLSGLGHIVVWNNTNSLIGVATWAGYYPSGLENPPPPLPIGLSIANSEIFKKNMQCAEKIKDAPNTTEGFDTLCT